MSTQRDDTLNEYYKAVDGMNMDAFKAMHTSDATVQFANFPTATGVEEISGAIGNFWSTISGLKHNFVNRWDEGEKSILEAKIDYTRQDGNVVTIPAVTIFKERDGKCAGLQVFIDVSPIYA